MRSVAVVVDNQNHEFLFNFLKRKCNLILVTEVPLEAILENPFNDNLFERLRIAAKIKRWVRENSNYQSVLIFSDYNFAYRTLVHYCRYYNKPIFLYQDGFIFFEPWPKNISGMLKRLVYQSLKLFGFDHLISYKSFTTCPNLVFSWGDFFSKTFRNITESDVVTLGSILHEKGFELKHSEQPLSNKFLYYGTFYRDSVKDKLVKTEAIGHLKNILTFEEDLICDVKLHPLDKNRSYFEQILRQNLLVNKIQFLGTEFLLHENISEYRFIISELSSETIFASLFCPNIYFIKNNPSEKHFKVLSDFLKKHHIGGKDYYKVDQNQINHFQSEFFQIFNTERFEKAVQKYN
jgi:hypothetical protein